jgi:hypothetical protein
MAGKNNFRELTSSGLATKEVKFQQTVHMKQAEEFKLVKKDVCEKVHEGICAAAAADWLSGKLGGSKGQKYTRGQGDHSRDIFENHEIAAKLARRQKKFLDVPGVDNAYQQLVIRHGLTVDVGFGKSTTGPFLDQVAHFQKRATDGDGVMLNYEADAEGKAHTVALCKVAGAFYFFDPNVGGYRINAGSFDQFFAKYKELCESKLEDWLVGKCGSYPVTKEG